MSFIEQIKAKAKKQIKTIVLPESEDLRVLRGAEIALKEGYSKIILIGNPEKVRKSARDNDIDIEEAEIINPIESKYYEEFVQKFYEMRKAKGMTEEKARDTIKQNIYFGVMMLKENLADGLVSGACHSTSDTLRPALQILKTAPNTKLVSAFFVMDVPNCEYGENGVFIFGDSGLNQNPNSEELSEIAISSADSFRRLIDAEPKVAMLSYSTFGSSVPTPLIGKVQNATRLVKEKNPDLIVDGEIQLDAAIVPEVAKMKAPDSKLKGDANVLIFPDLDAGNIGYKLVQRLAKAEAYGPLCQGIAKPVNDLSRGCSYEDVAGVIAITAVQAQG